MHSLYLCMPCSGEKKLRTPQWMALRLGAECSPKATIRHNHPLSI